MMRQRFRERFIVVLAVAISLGSTGVLVATEKAELYGENERAKKLIVHLTATGGVEGSGIIVNVDDQYVYGLTAKHVVLSRGKIVPSLQARLRMWPRALPAVVDRGHQSLDLAAFKVDYRALGLSAGEVLAALDFGQLGSSAELDTGDVILTIGHAAGGAWIDSKEPGHLASRDASQTRGADILALQHFCPPGHSGGGVFDERWNLVGMIIDNQDPFCHAIRVETLLKVLSDWKYPHQLRRSSRGEKGPVAPRDITVAVVDFDNRSSADIPDIGAAGRDITSSFLFNLPGVRVVTRDRLSSVNREIYLQGTKGSVSGTTRLGKLLEADAIVTGSVNRYDVERRKFEGYDTSALIDLYRMSITLQIIDIDSGEIRFSETFDIERKTTYSQATSAPREPLSRESELLEALLENTARDKVKSALRQISAGVGIAGRMLAIPITTEPPGAEVIIAGVVEGNTPLTVNLTQGIHEIEIVKVGYEPWVRRVKIVPDFQLVVHLSPGSVPPPE